jgi:uncharacterized coiled-coil protein SlyX
MSNEGTHISDRGAFVIMDIVVRLEDETIINLEIQKVGSHFPAKRFDCYCADLIMREYSRLRELHKKKFRYSQMPLVYSIVLFEQSPAALCADTEHYLHFGRMKTDTGIVPDSINRHVYVALDIFQKQMHNKPVTTELEAWLMLLTTQDLSLIEELITNFEGFGEIYQEIFQLRTKPEELIQMYDNIFYEADRNEDRLIIEEMQDTIDAQKTTIAERNATIAERNATISNLEATITALQQQLAERC